MRGIKKQITTTQKKKRTKIHCENLGRNEDNREKHYLFADRIFQ